MATFQLYWFWKTSSTSSCIISGTSRHQSFWGGGTVGFSRTNTVIVIWRLFLLSLADKDLRCPSVHYLRNVSAPSRTTDACKLAVQLPDLTLEGRGQCFEINDSYHSGTPLMHKSQRIRNQKIRTKMQQTQRLFQQHVL